MSPIRPAKHKHGPLHLARAEGFLQAAQVTLSTGLAEPAVSNAVVAAIRASDTICAVRLQQRWHGADHGGAAGLLAGATPEGKVAAPILSELLRSKNRAQYGIEEISREQARVVVELAEQLLELARRSVASSAP